MHIIADELPQKKELAKVGEDGDVDSAARMEVEDADAGFECSPAEALVSELSLLKTSDEAVALLTTVEQEISHLRAQLYAAPNYYLLPTTYYLSLLPTYYLLPTTYYLYLPPTV